MLSVQCESALAPLFVCTAIAVLSVMGTTSIERQGKLQIACFVPSLGVVHTAPS